MRCNRKSHKNITKTSYYGGSKYVVQNFRVIDFNAANSLSAVFVMISSMFVLICNRFHF